MKFLYQNHILFLSKLAANKFSDSFLWQISLPPAFKCNAPDGPDSYSILTSVFNAKKSRPKEQCYQFQNHILNHKI